MIWADELRADRPFFLHVSFPNPHHPFTVPEPYASMYKPEEMPEPLPPVTESVDATELQLGVFHGDSRIFVEGREADRVIGTPPANYSEYTTRNWQISKAIYYGMTTLMDDAIGRILDTLEETRLAENTIVVFLSDHGEYMGDHGFLGKGFYYDCVIRTPLIFAGPGIKCEPTQRLLAEVMAATDLSNGRRQSPVTPRRKAVVARQD
jgi:arylsulfatase A-like enzyme